MDVEVHDITYDTVQYEVSEGQQRLAAARAVLDDASRIPTKPVPI